MSAFEMSIWIDRPLQEVYAFISNPPNAVQYNDTIKDGQKLTEGPVRVGSQFAETRLVNGKEEQAELTVTECDPPQTFGIRNETIGIKVTYTYHLSPENNGTRLNWQCEVESAGLRRALLPVIAALLKQEDGNHLGKMKSLLEKAAASPSNGTGGAPAA